ncbi:hypothetical protein N799_02535 [Lysobacter arseniciresistens ZS79]|uniref:STAS domain-containing protein n=1 Tax=Lysobacter arseniciresistens ZS79 TaxID=913325 RepID=A0A0A0F2M3_9GAMM|nr:STAS domain-containing protein [Lysobacter arseniciresistens]KGM56785.1 hypothetical protein N799_02535 [Lysobacter arseniciresistens ZS79]
MAGAATVTREGDALVFGGVLDRAAVAAAWTAARPLLAGARRLDLNAVPSLDSAGLALLAELAAQLPDARIDGSPAGLAELRAAYRLDPALGFAG